MECDHQSHLVDARIGPYDQPQYVSIALVCVCGAEAVVIVQWPGELNFHRPMFGDNSE